MQKTVLTLLVFALSQTIANSQTPTPTPNPNAATYMLSADIQAMLTAMPKGDHMMRIVDIGKLNLGVGAQHRTPIKRSEDGTIGGGLIHHEQTETYIIISGSGTLVTGGTLYDTKEVPKDSPLTTLYNGPTVSGKVKDGHSQVVGPGDVIIIPPDVVHAWAEIPDHVDYLIVRTDPDKILPAGYTDPNFKK